LCPSTREEEEVIDSHNPNSLMVAELTAVYSFFLKEGNRLACKNAKVVSHGFFEKLQFPEKKIFGYPPSSHRFYFLKRFICQVVILNRAAA
jgi:hypothetical protein